MNKWISEFLNDLTEEPEERGIILSDPGNFIVREDFEEWLKSELKETEHVSGGEKLPRQMGMESKNHFAVSDQLDRPGYTTKEYVCSYKQEWLEGHLGVSVSEAPNAWFQFRSWSHGL